MILLSSTPRWPIPPLGGALLVAAALACGARQPLPPASAVPGAPAPVAPAAGAAPAGEELPPPPPAPEAARPSAATDSIVSLIAKPGLWPLDVDSARRVLEALGPVTREQPTEGSLELVGGPFGALERFDVAYSLDDERYWVFGSAGFLLEDPDPLELYRSIQARLTELLGRPLWIKGSGGDELPSTAWDIGEAMTLKLSPHAEGDEHQVLIAIAEQGDRR